MTEPDARRLIAEGLKRVAPEINFADIDLKAPLRNQVDLDSYDFYSMLAQIEKATNIRIPETALREMKDLSSLIRYLVEQSQKN
jgi:acyl carrier protein